MIEQVSHQVAGAKQPGAYTRLGDAEDLRNLHAAEFFKS
jgi:hypothetical protein